MQRSSNHLHKQWRLRASRIIQALNSDDIRASHPAHVRHRCVCLSLGHWSFKAFDRTQHTPLQALKNFHDSSWQPSSGLDQQKASPTIFSKHHFDVGCRLENASMPCRETRFLPWYSGTVTAKNQSPDHNKDVLRATITNGVASEAQAEDAIPAQLQA